MAASIRKYLLLSIEIGTEKKKKKKREDYINYALIHGTKEEYGTRGEYKKGKIRGSWNQPAFKYLLKHKYVA